jgi:hypothetical protein
MEGMQLRGLSGTAIGSRMISAKDGGAWGYIPANA